MKPHLAASPNPSPRPRGGGVLSPGTTGSALVLALAVVGLLVLPASAQTWVARYDGPAGDEDAARAIATDAEGNVYVTGASWGDGTGNDYATVKYGPDGAERWVTRYDGPAGGSDEATAIAVRGDRVAVTGGSAGAD
ncbi:MAG: SBBP repeat-containing protein, partial [bacterium]